MSTLAEPCVVNDDEDYVGVTVKLLINGVEYVPATSHFKHKISEKFSITLNGAAKMMLAKRDQVTLEVAFDNDALVYTVNNAQMSLQKLRLWT